MLGNYITHYIAVERVELTSQNMSATVILSKFKDVIYLGNEEGILK